MAHTSMVKIIDNEPERVVLVSWRPEKGEDVYRWVCRLKQRLELEFSPVTIIDSQEPSRDRASARELECTDFISLLTVEYAFACREDDHELLKYLPTLRDGVSPVCFWAVRLDPSKPRKWWVGRNQETVWKEGYRWHFLPGTDDYFDIRAKDIDTEMVQRCIEPLTEHEPDCTVCHANADDMQD